MEELNMLTQKRTIEAEWRKGDEGYYRRTYTTRLSLRRVLERLVIPAGCLYLLAVVTDRLLS